MEESPYMGKKTPEDSGLGDSYQSESNPSALYTPTVPVITSRKRKILEYNYFKHDLRQNAESVDSSPWTVGAGILSSTMNESITTAVEKCKLDSFAANFYTERSDYDVSNDTSSFLRKIKEPSTPIKSTVKRFSKPSPSVSPMLKLGSPERNGILYPTLQPNTSRFSNGKRCSPAKKCLFTPRSRKDPVSFFCKERNMHDVIIKVFLLLSDENLYTCSKVSKSWKGVITSEKNLKKKLKLFIKNKIMNKENDSPCLDVSTTPLYHNQLKQSTPVEGSKMYEVTNSLTEGQHLEKCISCNKPCAVVEKNISQCTSYNCGAIRCLKCNSISIKGPENFIDSCQQSMLLVDKPLSKYNLLGSPKRPTIFSDDYQNTSQSMNSSGYMTDTDMSQSTRHSLSFGKGRSDISQVLKVSNANNISLGENDYWERRNSIVPVISMTKKIEEIVEPSSPPKVKHIACSKKSKQYLKRLNI